MWGTLGAGVVATGAGLAKSELAARGAGQFGDGRADIVIVLEIVNGELKQRVDDSVKQRMLDRKAAIPDLAAERRRRSPYGALTLPSHESDPDHVSVVTSEGAGDTVEWRCAVPFVVTVDKDPGLTTVEGTPANPFGWTLPQVSQAAGLGHSVKARLVRNSGATTQRFYKFTAWAAGTKLDPDLICMM
jgi:hypothetical protein